MYAISFAGFPFWTGDDELAGNIRSKIHRPVPACLGGFVFYNKHISHPFGVQTITNSPLVSESLNVHESILQTIGETPLVRLNNVTSHLQFEYLQRMPLLMM